MQKDHEVRVFVSHISKHEKLKDEQINLLNKKINILEKHIQNLEERIQELGSWIWKPQKTNRPNKLGSKKNHKPHNRPIPDTIHEKKDLSLACCPDCNNRLSKSVRTRQRFVEDILPPKPHNTEYTIPYYWCTQCRKQVSPKPVGIIPKCRLGMRLMLYVTFLKYGMLLPYNKISTLLKQCCSISVSEGYLVDSITKFADYLGPEFEQIKQEIKNTKAVNIDETSWRTSGKNKVLWDFISEQYMLLLIKETKAQGIVWNVLGREYSGVVTSDSAKQYHTLGYTQQKCWAHVLRKSRKFDSEEGKSLHTILKALHRLGVNKDISVDELLKGLDSVYSVQYKDEKCIKLAKWLKTYRNEWFTFVEHEGIESTNNAAERGLRPSVVMRKITGGNRTPKGAHNHEVIMSVMGTWKKQDKDFFDEGLKTLQSNLP